MWPGDANNNGVVNGADFIYYGLAHGSTGPQRPNASTNWQPQSIVPWARVFPNGVNYAFADFDGDGKVDNSDQSKFESNWGRVHGTRAADGYARSAVGAPLKVELVPNAVEVTPGAALRIDVRVGSAQNPATNLYGLAFKLRYTQALVNNGGSDIDYEENGTSWFVAGGDTRKFFQKNETTGQAEVGMTHTDQKTVTGQGTVGSFSLIIEDIIVGRLVDTFKITIDSLVYFDGNLGTRPIAGDTIKVVVKDPRFVAVSEVTDIGVSVFPNPSQGDFYLRTAEVIENWEIFDAQGQMVNAQFMPIGHNFWRLSLIDTPAGMFMVRGRSQQKVLRKTLIKVR